MSGISLIVARADNGVIGNAGSIPWHISDDVRRFKRLTMGRAVVMGRKTWHSLPRKPLPGRLNIVISRNTDFAAEGAVIVRSFEDAISAARARQPGPLMVIGGADIYRQALSLADRVELTEVHRSFPGDVVLDAFDPASWKETAREEHVSPEGLPYSYVTLQRTQPKI
ncbi:MAG: dihydrofolate reductase [Alphaproteobacteria bacterium]|nr:dihydrofolate reductase [Alphaproteobacteria bacterium]